MPVVMQGPVSGYVPVSIIQRMKQLAPEHWSSEDFIIGQICVTYDYTHQEWTDAPEMDFVFDVDDQIKGMFEWADYMLKNDQKAVRKLLRMWRRAKTYEAQNESCSTGGEISEYLFDKWDDYFL